MRTTDLFYYNYDAILNSVVIDCGSLMEFICIQVDISKKFLQINKTKNKQNIFDMNKLIQN